MHSTRNINDKGVVMSIPRLSLSISDVIRYTDFHGHLKQTFTHSDGSLFSENVRRSYRGSKRVEGASIRLFFILFHYSLFFFQLKKCYLQ